jgi:hypothetical protein
MNGPPRRSESPIFPAFVVIAMPTILAFLPARYEFVPRFVPFIAAAALAIPMLAAGFAPTNRSFAFWERWTAAIVLPLATSIELLILSYILRDMARPQSGLSGLTLLTSSIAIWSTNILVFAIAYWQLDRGGPYGRATGWKGRADFSFTRGDPSDGVPEDWQPVFADYLALGFNTSAAFSPTDVPPLTPRAKMLMVAQSAISLVTVIAVGARAINILGS